MQTLRDEVQAIIKSEAAEYNSPEDFARDVIEKGCGTGVCGAMMDPSDVIGFFKRHEKEIADLVVDAMENSGTESVAEAVGPDWNPRDPFAYEGSNQITLAWWAFEKIARELYPEA